jgi:hypothetical protein
VLQDCVLVGSTGIVDKTEPWKESITLKNCTVLAWHGGWPLALIHGVAREASAGQPMQIIATDNVFDPAVASCGFIDETTARAATTVGELESLLSSRFEWRGRRNLYRERRGYLEVAVPGETLGVPRPTLQDWNDFWGQAETGSQEGLIRYQGGDLHARTLSDPEQLTPQDFRLRPDSAGYRAGPDGKDLGADINFVGPGEAYERWKKTPAYNDWQKETRALMKTAIVGRAAEVVASATTEASPQTKSEASLTPVENTAQEQPVTADN